ncbi:autotransporter outer membrane beta-barrel domain-containing protein [Serratia bockelmannii]|uniref:autotransporter outer membrane beta-barrel domain-containing protein n=1 Tax=Serratia bockelmannii TaxID=2703793 RepID=UPI003CE9D401
MRDSTRKKANVQTAGVWGGGGGGGGAGAEVAVNENATLSLGYGGLLSQNHQDNSVNAGFTWRF